jgi:transcriptional regulator with XRE-family HTH domain
LPTVALLGFGFVIPLAERYHTSAAIRLRAVLKAELSRRKRANPRYSLRAFARSLSVEHSTLSQFLRGKRTVTWRSIQGIANTMHWTGAAILQLSKQRGFCFDSRVIAGRLGVSVDEANVALFDLCLFGLIQLKGE